MRPYKCAHCTKRYKTMVGLSNHMQQGHQRLSIPSMGHFIFHFLSINKFC